MTTLQELYREFEINRVLHLAPGEGATKPVTEVTPSVEAPKELKTTHQQTSS